MIASIKVGEIAAKLGLIATLFVLPGGVGTYWIIDGRARGRQMAAIDPLEVRHLVVQWKAGKQVRLIRGLVEGTGEKAEVEVFSNQYESLAVGDRLEIYRLQPGGREYIARSKYDESRPFVRIGNFAASWHFPSGIAMVSLSLFALCVLGRDLLRGSGARGRAVDVRHEVRLSTGAQCAGRARIFSNGDLQLRFFDYSDETHSMYGDDVAWTWTVASRHRPRVARLLQERTGSPIPDDAALLDTMAGSFPSFHAVLGWLHENKVPMDEEREPEA